MAYPPGEDALCNVIGDSNLGLHSLGSGTHLMVPLALLIQQWVKVSWLRADSINVNIKQNAKVEKTPVIIKQIVEDIDNVVKVTRFEGWQWTTAGEREIQKALRRTLLKYQLHKEQELFDKAYAYIREHY